MFTGDDYTLRGKIIADYNGKYTIDIVIPDKYSEDGYMRPYHIHLKVSAPDNKKLTTQIYFEGDTDMVKKSLIMNWTKIEDIVYAEHSFTVFEK